MPASQEQKVDFLLKKIGYSASKTGIAEDSSLTGSTKKAPFAEAIPSPLVLPASTIWSESGFISATPPSSNTAYVGIYTAANAYRMTYDNTVGAARRTFIARSSYGNQSSSIDGDWIDTQFGADYIVQVYKGDPNSGGVALQQAGANAGTDGWFFDYSSGVLNFNGTNLPSGITETNIYIVGYRYTGRKGVQPEAGIGTFHDLVVSNNFSVGGISTFTGLIDANGIIEATAGQNKIPSLYNAFSDLPNAGTYHGMFAHVHATGRGYFAHAGNWMELVNKETNGVIGTGTERYNIGPVDATSLKVTGITTLGNIGISTGLISGPATMYIDPVVGDAGDPAGLLIVKGNLQVDGTQTIVNSSVMRVNDKNIVLAKNAANDAAADTGGITVESGDGDKTWQWLDGTDSWTSSEHIRIPDDKVFGFASDTNTFISRPAADTFAFTSGGSEKVRITSDGYVGIGLTNPASLLHLEGTGGATSGLKFENGAGKNVTFYLNNNTSSSQFSINYGGTGGSDIQIAHNGQVVLAPSGLANVGIGTYTPLYKLDVRGSIGGFDDLRAHHSTTVKTYTVTVATKDATHRYPAGGDSSSNGYKIDGEFSPFITLTPGRTYRFDQSDSSNATHQIKFYLEADKTTLYEGGVTYNGTAGSSGAYTQIVVGDETPVVLHYQCINHGYMGNAVQVNSNVVNTNYDAFLRGNLSVTGLSTFSDNIFIPDNKKIRFGDPSSPDLEIYHSGTASFISDIGGGVLKLTTDGLRVRNALDNQNMIKADQNLGVELFYNNIKRFTTSGIGVTIIGEADVNGDLNVSGISTTTQLEIGTLGQSLVGITTILDEDNMASDSAEALATQQSIKAYVDSSNPTGSNLAVSADSGSNESINLATEVLDIEGTANEIETATGTNKVVIGLPNNVTIGNNLTVTSQLNLNGTVSAGSTTGTDGYYLKSTGIGVTWTQFPTARNSQVFTVTTAGQTTFSFTYNVNYLDVFVNGVKLPASEFTASNGTSVVLDDGCFVNDTVELVTYNTVPSSSSGAQALDQLNDVSITGTPVVGETLQHNGSEFVNDYTPTATLTSTTQVVILSLPIATYRSAEYTIQVTEGTKYHVTKILAIHDGTNVTFNEYGTLTTSTSLSTFALDVNSGNMRLLVTPASTNSTVFKVKFTAIKV